MRSGISKLAVLLACFLLPAPTTFALGENAILQNIQTFFKQLPPAKKQELGKKKIKTVLIRTVRSKETSSEAKEVRMRVDLQSETLIDDSAYEFTTPLPAGTIAKVKLESDYVGP